MSPLNFSSIQVVLLPHRALLALCCSAEQSPPPFSLLSTPCLGLLQSYSQPNQSSRSCTYHPLDSAFNTNYLLCTLVFPPTLRPFFPPQNLKIIHYHRTTVPTTVGTITFHTPLFPSVYPPASSLHQSIQSLVPHSIGNSFPLNIPGTLPRCQYQVRAIHRLLVRERIILVERVLYPLGSPRDSPSTLPYLCPDTSDDLTDIHAHAHAHKHWLTKCD